MSGTLVDRIKDIETEMVSSFFYRIYSEVLASWEDSRALEGVQQVNMTAARWSGVRSRL